MASIEKLDEKIAKLQKQKETLQKKVSMSLLKDLSSILGEEFSPELVLSIVSDAWNKADKKTKEAWQDKASTFRQKKQTARNKKTKAA